ncbi:MAG TPA: RNA methyltransferase [Thermoanaerobaculia bacterium]|nr:RNA methyltransferase [Thermoanaerobaculia bacterium]
MKIASTSNPRIQAALRAVEGGERLLLEGARAIGEALAAGIVPREIFLEGDEGPPRDDAVRGAAERGAALCHVTSKVLSRLSDLPSTRGVVALAVPPRRALPDLRLPDDALVLFLDGIQDPANVGATLRSAEAFGVAAALLTPDCASPFSPKSVRASALSALRLPIATGVSPDDAAAWAAESGAVMAGAETRGGEPPAVLSGIRPLVLVVGSEGRGISPALEARLSRRVTIPLAGRVESLNAAVAAGILLALASGREV